MSVGRGPGTLATADRTGTGPAGSATLVLARHAETIWHAENRYAGNLSDIDLTPAGRRQSAQLAAWAAGHHLAAVASSPVRRALETAQPCADAAGLPLLICPDLREVDFGIAEGRTMAEVAQTDPQVVEQFRHDPAGSPFPGGEPPAHAAGRAAAQLRSLAGDHPEGIVLVVAHNTLLRLALCALLELPLSRYRTVFPRLDNAAISEIRIGDEGSGPASLLSLNSRLNTIPEPGPDTIRRTP